MRAPETNPGLFVRMCWGLRMFAVIVLLFESSAYNASTPRSFRLVNQGTFSYLRAASARYLCYVNLGFRMVSLQVNRD